MADLPEYVLDRAFDAPRDMVWAAWTDPKLLSTWYGPNIETIIHKFDLREGGEWLNEMKMGENSMLSKSVFGDVIPSERLTFDQSSTDKDWNIVSSPMMPDWPRVISNVITFEEEGGKTKLRLVWTPVDATDAEVACFEGAVSRMGGGWESGFAILDKMLADMQA